MATGTKEKIFQEGLRLFRERGYTNVTIEEICAAAEVTRSTFYYHYKTKDELLDSVYAEYDEGYTTDTLADILLMTNRWEQIWRITGPSIKYTVKLGSDLVSQLMAVDLTEQRHIFNTGKTQTTVGVVEKIIIAGQQAGQFRNEADAKTLAEVVSQKILIGNTFLWCASNGEFDLYEKVKDDLMKILNVQPELL